eukprot:GHUV01020210.1.p5 GENE.GHUV01020210.1~~GHUV01020210.1.p5  ORF type:complete len:101 (+),score=43.11 GHUV01020210.1:404-706(+)
MAWSQCICSKLQAQGYWCDYIDPCSGLPVSIAAPASSKTAWHAPALAHGVTSPPGPTAVISSSAAAVAAVALAAHDQQQLSFSRQAAAAQPPSALPAAML